jgi:hypothetical protein
MSSRANPASCRADPLEAILIAYGIDINHQAQGTNLAAKLVVNLAVNLAASKN